MLDLWEDSDLPAWSAIINNKIFKMAVCISAAPLIHGSPNALQTVINITSQQPCEVGGSDHPHHSGDNEGTKNKGWGAVVLGLDLALGHLSPLRPSASDHGFVMHGFDSVWGYTD